MAQRRICFVTGTRAEFGLMQSTLRAIGAHSRLRIQIIATGMHADRRRGLTLNDIRSAGFSVDRVVQWNQLRGDPPGIAAATGEAIAELSRTFRALRTEVVLVVGDRVEAFAAAAAGNVSGLVVAHVHGGDRAMGQVDDSLRHAITKLAHVHFAATIQSARRIGRLGEDAWRIHHVGAPGIDGIRIHAASPQDLRRRFPQLHRKQFALLALHPVDADPSVERRRARLILDVVKRSGIPHIAIIFPNNDSGSHGILQCWSAQTDARVLRFPNLPRADFLGLLRDCVMLLGNSSAGIVEAASFGTPVVDIGPRQSGREHGRNVVHVPYSKAAIKDAIEHFWRGGRPVVFPSKNPYQVPGTPRRIARALASLQLDQTTRRKLIAY